MPAEDQHVGQSLPFLTRHLAGLVSLIAAWAQGNSAALTKSDSELLDLLAEWTGEEGIPQFRAAFAAGEDAREITRDPGPVGVI